MRLTASELIGFHSFEHSEVMWPFSLHVKHLPSLISCSRSLAVSWRLGLAGKLVVRVVVVLVVATFLAGEVVEAAARFSMYQSDAAFVRAASLSLWEMR